MKRGFENFLILRMVVIFPLRRPSRVILVVLALAYKIINGKSTNESTFIYGGGKNPYMEK